MHVRALIKGLGIDPLKKKGEDDDDGKDKGQKEMKGSVNCEDEGLFIRCSRQ